MRVGLEARPGPATAAPASRWGSWTSGQERAAEAPPQKQAGPIPAPALWPGPGSGSVPSVLQCLCSARRFLSTCHSLPCPRMLCLPSRLGFQPGGNSHRPQGVRTADQTRGLSHLCKPVSSHRARSAWAGLCREGPRTDHDKQGKARKTRRHGGHMGLLCPCLGAGAKPPPPPQRNKESQGRAGRSSRSWKPGVPESA